MKSKTLRHLIVCASIALGSTAALAADEKPAAPADGSTATAKPDAGAKRTMQQIMQDLQAQDQDLRNLIPSPQVFTDKAKREAIADKALPLLRKMEGDFEELKSSGDPQGQQIAQQALPQFKIFLAVMGDKDTADEFEKDAAGTDKAKAFEGRSSIMMVSWIKAANDAAAQEKLVDEAQKLAKENPDSDSLTNRLGMMSEMGASSPDIANKIRDIISSMTSPSAQGMKEQIARQKQLASMENKPLTIEGVKLDGTKFSTADWKGKVIFVDFWATWCGPCRAELPRVKKAYADFHDKGLEVLGVSCDRDGDDLKKFLDDNKDMPWPQLFDLKNPGWHPLATSYGINSIPTMFLIDKKGVLRSVTARENFEEMIPKLLAEGN